MHILKLFISWTNRSLSNNPGKLRKVSRIPVRSGISTPRNTRTLSRSNSVHFPPIDPKAWHPCCTEYIRDITFVILTECCFLCVFTRFCNLAYLAYYALYISLLAPPSQLSKPCHLSTLTRGKKIRLKIWIIYLFSSRLHRNQSFTGKSEFKRRTRIPVSNSR